jgi:acyl-CoA dehydrogenase
MAFFQAPPALGNQFLDDRVLRGFVARTFDADARKTVEPELLSLGELAGGELYRMQLSDRHNEPVLTPWDAWGHRVDRIEVSPLWQRAAREAAERGLVATGHEGKLGALSRMHQFLLVYLFDGSTDVYTCPLAMTDGAATTLKAHGGPVAERALSRLLSRDPQLMWTSGQWMTERTGGSDVGLTETVARADASSPGSFRLHGTKWFTSATTGQMALTLARPEGNPMGGRGLALFYVEVRDAEGRLNGIAINRLKDKLGTRKVPTAELTLDGTLAMPVAGTSNGIRNIAPMLNVTRTWNSVCAVASMRRAVALARDYAKKRVQFGAPLSEKPLHLDTLATLAAEHEAAFHFVFWVVELIGKLEHGTATPREEAALRLLTPLVKLTTGKQAVAVASEAIECFGGAGYVEDTGLPRILRDAQVLSIWEGTTNVLSLDVLRAIAKEGALEPFLGEIEDAVRGAHPDLANEARVALGASRRAASWLERTFASSPGEVEAGARRFALTLGRAAELARLVRHASLELSEHGERRSMLAAKRFVRSGVDLVWDDRDDEVRALAMDEPHGS